MKRLRLLIALILLSGCASIQYQDQPQSVNKLISEGQMTRIRVLAQAEDWRNSGVVVEKGKKYEIRAKGRWTLGPQCPWSGPDGIAAHNLICPAFGFQIIAGWSGGTLIGKIGKDGKPFVVGNELDIEPEQEGLLYFRTNDTIVGDNEGHADVTISLRETEKKEIARPITTAESEAKQKVRPIVDQLPHSSGQKWAVVIGISNYRDTRIAGLRYASTDAQAFHNWLISPQGGGYAPSRTRLFLNAEATAQSIRNVLFNWLKQALEEDMVTIYFAGHGSPESPDSPNNLFLLPSDANYDDVASTGFPMWDIETALKRFIKAKKVVVIADACHAGGVGQAFDIARRANRGVEINPISSGLQNLSKVGDGVAVISASDDKQYSQEGMAWGGGHGVFTYFLLKGLTGDADYNKDGRVTLGELIPYLSEQVRRETRNSQSPTVAGKFDPALSIGR